jgi:hypothetical protein
MSPWSKRKYMEAIFLWSIQAILAPWLVNLSRRRLFASDGAMRKFDDYSVLTNQRPGNLSGSFFSMAVYEVRVSFAIPRKRFKVQGS